MPHLQTTSRRELGSFYTPESIAESIVHACLDRWRSTAAEPVAQTGGSVCRVLDPACGDGAFLLPVFDELIQQHYSAGSTADNRLRVVREQIFGVDIDPQAVSTLRSRLLVRIAPPADLAAEAAMVVHRNILCGDSLSGPDFSDPQQSVHQGISWSTCFPEAASAGGFDVIVGNPPYLRERSAKALFDRLAVSAIGRRWREARMDLWFYFLHRGLDLLRPGGVLSFIVNSYWMSSRGASRLIKRLERETTFHEIQLLNDAPVFETVAGRHMILRLRRDVTTGGRAEDQQQTDRDRCRVITGIRSDSEQYFLTHDELFQHSRLVVAKPDPRQCLFRNRTALGDRFATRQGVAENPPCINRRLFEEFPGRFELGAGVFVLTAREVAGLSLAPGERDLLRPYYDTYAVGRYRLSEEPTHQLLYLTRQTAPGIDSLPAIRNHLEKFRPILDRRREVQLGRCAWWHLHWPRDEEIFQQPKVLSVQMGRRPQFAFCARPAFVGFSVNLILPGAGCRPSLEALTGILNSDPALTWFERHAKRRGIHLEINAHVLREFPLPGRDEPIEGRIGELVCVRQNTSDVAKQTQYDSEIERLVAQLYDRL